MLPMVVYNVNYNIYIYIATHGLSAHIYGEQ